jgi:hypothetical protein
VAPALVRGDRPEDRLAMYQPAGTIGACPIVGRMSLVRVGQRERVLRCAYRDVIGDEVQDLSARQRPTITRVEGGQPRPARCTR